jgi:excisionase family DNA binding protein
MDRISTTEAARILGVTPRAVSRWISAGRLQGWRVGSHWKTTVEACEAFAKPSVAGGTDAATAILASRRHRQSKAKLAAMGML